LDGKISFVLTASLLLFVTYIIAEAEEIAEENGRESLFSIDLYVVQKHCVFLKGGLLCLEDWLIGFLLFWCWLLCRR
jgi:hypothetical protein